MSDKPDYETSSFTANTFSSCYEVYSKKVSKPKAKLSFTPYSTTVYHNNDITYSFEDDSSTSTSTSITPTRSIKKISSNKIPETSNLFLLNECYENLINSIKSNEMTEEDIDNKPQIDTPSLIKRSLKKTMKTIKVSSKEIILDELCSNIDDLDNLTNTEEIQDFYDYTNNCMDMIVKLKEKKDLGLQVNFGFDMTKKKRIAVFDLDETLVHCAGVNASEYQHKIEIVLPSKNKVMMGLNIRPHWKEMITLIQNMYHIVIYTASHHSYADAVLDFMDPQKKYFKHRLYRNHCIQEEIDGHKVYIKDLSIIEDAPLKDMVIIDNSVLSFPYHLDNGIPILPYYNSSNDCELTWLSSYLITISSVNDLRKANRDNIQMNNFLKEAKEKIVNPSRRDSFFNQEKILFYQKKNINGALASNCK